MNRFKQVAKSAMGETLLRTGLWRRHLERMARRGEAIVLTYHRVIEKWDRTLDYSQPGMVVTADTFDHQLTFLKHHFNIVSLSDLVSPQSEIRNPKSPIALDPRPSTLNRPLCAITFDDGWRDNYEIAFPILRIHRVPATIFLTTDFIGTGRAFWHTELIYLIMRGDLSGLARHEGALRAYPSSVCSSVVRLARMRRGPTAYDVDRCIETVKKMCKEDVIEGLIKDLASALGVSRPFFPGVRWFLDWDQVREMAAAGIEIASHGRSHRMLTRLKSEEVEEELARSKAEIEGCIGKEAQHFAFPDGAASRELVEAVAKAGYKTACLCAFAPDGGMFSPVALPRLGMHEGVSSGSDGAFSEALLLLWLFRCPRMRLI